MALRTYVNGAWEDIDDLQTPEVDGARETADVARIYQNGAWEEVWSDVKLLKLNYESLRNVTVRTMGEWGENLNIWTMHDDGSIIYLAEQGSWNNPTISFDYWGYCYYKMAGNPYDHFISVADLYAYGIKADGTKDEVLIDDNVDTHGSDISRMLSISYTFTGGEYQRVGFKLIFKDHSDNLTQANAYEVNYHFAIKNILIDNRKYITDATEDFEQGTV